MKIQLIKAPTPNTGMPEHDWYAPLNLIWLANLLILHGYEVEILDGQLMDLDQIVARLSGDVVGVSFDILSIDAFDRIVAEARSRGCFTVAGGHLATALGPVLLKNNRDLQAVILYDGDHALLETVRSIERGRALAPSIPNILFRHDERLVEGPIKDVDLLTLPTPRRDVGGIALDAYFANYQKAKHALGLPFKYERPTNSYSHKGCPFRANGTGCSFCSRVDRRVRYKSGAQVYEEYRYLVVEHRVDHISDFADSWISASFLRSLLQHYDACGPVGATLRVYGDIRHVTPETASLMRQLGVETVLLGIESGNEEILRLNGKPITRSQILKAVACLAKNDIRIADAYVLGLIGETRDTVKDTVDLAHLIRRTCQTEISYWNIMTPLPGSHVWDHLLQSGEALLTAGYHLVPERLERTAITALCNLGPGGYDYLADIRETMLCESPLPSAEFVSRRENVKELA